MRPHRSAVRMNRPGPLLAALFFLALAPGAARAQFICTTNDGAITITGHTTLGPSIAIPNWITGKPVIRIGPGAFKDCTGLGTVLMGSNLLSIGDSAFYGCMGLTNVVIGESVTNIEGSAFFACMSLPSVVIPDRVAGVGELVFYNCPALTNVTFGSNVTFIGNAAFYYCTGLTDVRIPAGVTRIEPNLFYNCERLTNVVLPDGLSSIGFQAFCMCTNLAGIRIPAGVTRLERLAFDYCTRLTEVTVPSGVTSLEDCVFYYCTSLTNVVLPPGITRINYAAFWSCSNLLGVTIPPVCTNIGESAFSSCASLTRVAIPDSVVRVGNYAFFTCPALTNITIGRGVISLGTWALARCTNLTAITVDPANLFYSSVDGVLFNKSRTTLLLCPGGKAGSYTVATNVTRLADYSFDSCVNLTNVVIPGTVSVMGFGLFFGCRNLASVTLGPNIAFLDGYAFSDCDNLRSVTFLGNAPAAGYGVFNNSPQAIAYYMPGATNWGGAFAERPAVLYTVFSVLPPRAIGKKTFTARWAWGEGGGTEGELCVSPNMDFTSPVPGFEARYVANSPECQVTNLATGRDYWYRVRRLLPDGSATPWSARMKVRTGTGLPAFRHLLGEGPAAKGVSQAFAVTNLMGGGGTLGVKSSNANAVKPVLSAQALTLQYLWKDTNTAVTVTVTLAHPDTGYKVSYTTLVSRATGTVAIVGRSALTNAGTAAAQEFVLENRTGERVTGLRLRASGLDQPAWLLNRTGLDPATQAAVREIPCVLPPGSQLVARLVFAAAYKKQARTRPATIGAWAVMTPMGGAGPVEAEMTVTRQVSYAGLRLLGLPADRNRLYGVWHSDDDGVSWEPDPPAIRAPAGYVMWLDLDPGRPTNRLYRVVDAGF